MLFPVGLLWFPLLPALRLLAEQNLQTFLKGLVRGRLGAVGVSNRQTGKLLAIWNPRVALGRAVPPGSAAEIAEAAAALEEGVVSASDRIFCRRVPELPVTTSIVSIPAPAPLSRSPQRLPIPEIIFSRR